VKQVSEQVKQVGNYSVLNMAYLLMVKCQSINNIKEKNNSKKFSLKKINKVNRYPDVYSLIWNLQSLTKLELAHTGNNSIQSNSSQERKMLAITLLEVAILLGRNSLIFVWIELEDKQMIVRICRDS